MTFRSTPRTPSAYDYQLTIKQLLRTSMVQNADQEIVYRGTQRFTYRQWRERVGRLASALETVGARQGSTIAVMDWDSHRYLECFFAIPMMGCVMQTVNIRLSPEQILYTLNHAGADVLLVNADFIPLVAAIRAKLEKDVQFVLIRDEDAPSQPGADLPFAGEYEALLENSSPDYDFPELDENTLATTFYTSGTTGNPKGVYYSHRQLVLHTLGVAAPVGTAANCRIHREDVYLPITPMFHVHAWGVPYVATMLGLKQIYCGRYDGGLLLKLIRDEGVTLTHCVPTLLHMLLTHPDAGETDLSHVKMVVGGSALPVGLAKKALERGIDVMVGWGMSETAPVISMAFLSTAETKLDIDTQARLRTRSGRAIALCDMHVVDDDGKEVAHDGQTQGELTVTAPWLTQGYYKAPDKSETLWQGGRMHTGDIATIDADGWMVIRDRLKDVVKSGGEWVSSLTLENIISQHPGVGEVAVIAEPDAKWGERPMALIVPGDGQGVDTEAVRKRLEDAASRGEISRYGVPDKILLVKELAKTSVGKLDKKLLRKTHAGAA